MNFGFRRIRNFARKNSLVRLLAYALRAWHLLTGAALFLITNSLLELAVPWVTGFLLLDRVIKRADLGQLPVVVALLVGIFVAQKISDFLSDYFRALMTQRLIHTLRCDLYEHLETLPVRFFDHRQSGELLARLTGDVDNVDTFVTTVTQELAGHLITFIGAIALLFAINAKLTLFVLPTILALSLCVHFFRGSVRRNARHVRQLIGEMAAAAAEMLSGVRLVKAFCAEQFEAKRFSDRSSKVVDARVEAVKLQALYSSVVDACVLAGTIIVIVVASRWAVSGVFTVGALVAYLGYLNKIYSPVKSLSKVNLTIQKSLVAADRVFELMDLAPESSPREAGESEPREEKPRRPEGEPSFLEESFDSPGTPRGAGAAVTFEDVTFGYAPDRLALKRFTLDVAPGEVVALVGHSGGGKTTAVSLLLRFYNPASGRILIDGVPLEDMPLDTLRRQIAVVPQETFLFSGTVRDNIAYACPEATDQDVLKAARAAMAHEFIAQLPSGYLSQVGERGVKLSGGQRQRIAIARAFLRNPRILIFDEATSHLDSESERLVQQALAKITPGRTVLVIAHRFSSIARAGRIVVIEDGEIVEAGSHEELLALNGVYHRLHALQWDAPHGLDEELT